MQVYDDTDSKNIEKSKPGLCGITHSNRDFTQADTWGKNQFNSSFPVGLTNFLAFKNLSPIYIRIDKNLKTYHATISTEQLYGARPFSDDLFFAFESQYSPYQQLVIGTLPRVDLVTQSRHNGQALRPLEVKLTALPDNPTCHLDEEEYGCELVIRPDTIVYLACSIVINFKEKPKLLFSLIGNHFENITDWSYGNHIIPYLHEMIAVIDKITIHTLNTQRPILLQPIWKTLGKSSKLAKNCLDVFVWSNLAFIQLFMNCARSETFSSNKITRQNRSIIWLFKMLYDFAKYGKIYHHKTIDELSYNTKNDKAFAVNGRITHKFMAGAELTKPRIRKQDIRKIILGGGQDLLSPERRFDAIIFNSPELFY